GVEASRGTGLRAPAWRLGSARGRQPAEEPAVTTAPSLAYALRPWTDVVRPHPDVASGDLAMGTYAANIAKVAMSHDAEPVYADAEAFFAATYFTPTMV